MKDRFAARESAEMTTRFAWDNAVLQCAYLIVAARAQGLDAGPMGGSTGRSSTKNFSVTAD